MSPSDRLVSADTATEQAPNDNAQDVKISKIESKIVNEDNKQQASSAQSKQMDQVSSRGNGRHLSQQSEQTAKDSSNIDSTPPGRVGMVIVEVVSSNQIDLKWTGVKDSDLSHYNIYMGTKSSFRVIPGVTEPTGTSTTNSYSSTGLKPSTKYYYKIAAVDDSGNAGTLSTMYGITHAASTQGDDQSVKATASTQSDDNSVKATASTQSDTPPRKISGLSISSVSSTQINLKWSANRESDISHYNVYKGTKSSFKVKLGGTVPTGTSTTNSYSSTGLNPSTKYYYKVAAVDTSGHIGSLSNAKYGKTKSGPSGGGTDTTPPGPVTGLIVTTVSSTQLNLAWSQVKASDFNHYNIYRGTSGFSVTPGVTQPAGTSVANSYANTGLAPSTKYSYRVAAVDNAGNIGPLSSQVSKTTASPEGSTPPPSQPPPTADTTPPAQVSGLTVSTVSTSQLKLTWNQVTASDFDHYNIYRGTSANFPVTLGTTNPAGTTTSTSYSSTGLSPSTTYYYKVAAVDVAGNIGPVSTEKSGTTSSSSGTQSSVGLYVPLYTYPTSSTWSTLVSTKNAHPNLPMLVAINPSSGVGSSKDNNFVNGINNLKSAGIKVIGYVYTSYGQRSTSAMQDEINKYKSWYGVDGIFFDEMSNSGGLEGYYSNINNFVKSTGMTFTMGNPGTDTSSSYVGTMDNIIIYERQGLPSVDSLKGWHTNYDKKNFSIIPYGVSSLDTQFINNVKNYVGWIYITNDGLPNPWDSLPSYFNNLVSALDP